MPVYQGVLQIEIRIKRDLVMKPINQRDNSGNCYPLLADAMYASTVCFATA